MLGRHKFAITENNRFRDTNNRDTQITSAFKRFVSHADRKYITENTQSCRAFRCRAQDRGSRIPHDRERAPGTSRHRHRCAAGRVPEKTLGRRRSLSTCTYANVRHPPLWSSRDRDRSRSHHSLLSCDRPNHCLPSGGGAEQELRTFPLGTPFCRACSECRTGRFTRRYTPCAALTPDKGSGARVQGTRCPQRTVPRTPSASPATVMTGSSSAVGGV